MSLSYAPPLTDLPPEPFALFAAWLALAADGEPSYPEAACLATVSAEGVPSARMVLVRGPEAGRFQFYSNYESAKGRDLRTQPQAALCWHWKSVQRQVRAEGTVTRLSAEESATYFASRPRGSQIAAWASAQSRPLESRAALAAAVAAVEARTAGQPVPCPPHWGGYQLQPARIEFWLEQPFRLHDRVLYTHHDGRWTHARLNP